MHQTVKRACKHKSGKAAEDDVSKLGPVLNKPFAVPALELSPFAGVESCCGVSSLDV